MDELTDCILANLDVDGKDAGGEGDLFQPLHKLPTDAAVAITNLDRQQIQIGLFLVIGHDAKPHQLIIFAGDHHVLAFVLYQPRYGFRGVMPAQVILDVFAGQLADFHHIRKRRKLNGRAAM